MEVEPTSSRLRILHVTKRYWPFKGGVEKYVEDLAAAQAAAGHCVRILTIDRDLVGRGEGRLPAVERHGPVHVARVPALGSARKQIAVGHYRRIVRELRAADVVHHHDPRFLFETAVLVRRLIGRPIIFHTHGLIWHTTDYAGLKRLVMRYYYGPILRHFVDATVADSEGDLTLLASTGGVAGSNVHLVRNAIDLTRFRAILPDRERGLIVSFGRLDTHKGLDRLIAALARTPGDWRLAIAGTGHPDLLGRLKAAATAAEVADRISWLGYVSDEELTSLMARAWLAVFPSRFEGFGLALLEALAAGIPVLASDLPTHREILGVELESRIVAFDDASSVAQAIADAIRLTDEQVGVLSLAERERASGFEVGSLADGISALYEGMGLVGPPRSSRVRSA